MSSKKIKNGTLVVKTTTTYVVDWHKADFCKMTDDFVKARSKMKDKMNRCFACDWPFQRGDDQTGENMNLVCFKGLGNELLCDECYEEITK